MTGATLGEPVPRSVVSLTDLEATDVGRFGGKGSGLARLRRAGFPVPDAFLVGVDAGESLLARAVDRHGGDPNGLAAEIRLAPLPRQLIGDLEACLDALGPLAVRSSAVREDGASRAGAGQYESALGVADAESLADACRSVLASQFSAHARAYWGEVDGAPRNEMALILQRMLAPASSGVIFTADPVSGREDVFLLEACFGLGTSVVRGDGVSERMTIRRGGEVESRAQLPVAAAEFFDPASAAILVREPGGGEVLSATEVTALVEVAASVGDLLGMPLDIEWSIEDGRLFLLQARPITAGRGWR